MAFKMKNPEMGKIARAAGSPHKFGIAGEMRGVDSASRGREGMDTKSPMKRPKRKKAKTDDSMVIEGSKAAKKAEKRQEREQKKQAKAQAKELKRFGGDQEKLDAYKAKKAEGAEKMEQYKRDYAADKYDEQGNLTSRGLASQGKGYIQEDESGDRHYVRAKRGGQEAVTGAVSRETMKRREANERMTAEEHDKMAQDYFAKKRAEREAGEGGPLNKKKSALKNYKKGYYGIK